MMKSERVTFLASPDFKQYLAAEAFNGGISVGELIRKRCLPEAANQADDLAALTGQLRRSIAEARKSLDEGLQAAAEALARLNQQPAPQETTRRAARKAA